MGRLSHHLLQALQSLRLAPYASTITVLTVAVSLSVSGGIWLGTQAIKRGLSRAAAQPRMTLFLADDTWEETSDVAREDIDSPVSADSVDAEDAENSADSTDSDSVVSPLSPGATNPAVASAQEDQNSEPAKSAADSPATPSLDTGPEALMRRVSGLSGEGTVVQFISADVALRSLRESLGSMGSALDHLAENPLPASIELHLPHSEQRNLSELQELATKLAALPGVSEVDYGESLLLTLESTLGQIRRLSLAVFASVLCLALFLITNVVRLSVYARREEIEILRLVGASKLFIALPFLFEGALVGLLGGLLAVFGIGGLYSQVFAASSQLFAIAQDFQPAAPTRSQGLLLLALAVSVGFSASLLATLRFLRRAR